MLFLANVKEHATLSAEMNVDHGVGLCLGKIIAGTGTSGGPFAILLLGYFLCMGSRNLVTSIREENRGSPKNHNQCRMPNDSYNRLSKIVWEPSLGGKY